MRRRWERVASGYLWGRCMCGYCVESAYFDGDPSSGSHLEGSLQYVHLQESPDWFEYYSSRENDLGKVGDMIALCRAWDDRFFRPERNRIFDLQKKMGWNQWDALVQWLRPYAPSPQWEWLIPNEAWICYQPDIKSARRVLADYCDSHLGWNGIKKPRRRKSQKHEEMIPERIFWVHAALILVDRFDTLLGGSIDIPLNLPKRTPSFDGLDLWLQRRAVRSVVRSNGSGFISTYREEMREEILSSVIAAARADADYLADLGRSIRQDDCGKKS